MISEAICTSATTENKTNEPKKSLSLVRVQVEESKTDAPELMPKWPCGGILISD